MFYQKQEVRFPHICKKKPCHFFGRVFQRFSYFS